MKKLIILTAIASLATFMFACKKEPFQLNNPGNNPFLVQIVGDWSSLSFDINADDATSLKATAAVLSGSVYDLNEHVQLAFVKMSGANSTSYAALPMNQASPQGNIELAFLLDYAQFNVIIRNTDDPSTIPAATAFQGYEFRYIVIPYSVYNGHNIDWGNYLEVATALNLPL